MKNESMTNPIPQLALARRLRPRSFNEVVGQEVTIQALSNALRMGRLHHAYLFTGTHGVGKTSLARIFAKCLNCEQGITSEPCGKCETCLAIDAACCVDVLEVDAASRTKVEDTREILENVQYLPARARFKIYLIDEVHMLSSHSFNALLKTLEEPPAHVKFLFATTDPQKLPLTVLSRCLEFHLFRLSFAHIVSYLQQVLTEEKIAFEVPALQAMARAAEGSLRDALSLLDQAIAYSNRHITAEITQKMLGLTETSQLLGLLQAIFHRDPKQALQNISGISDKTTDFSEVLSELLMLLRHIAILQEAPDALEESACGGDVLDVLLEWTKIISAEEIQLYYQIGVLGQKEMPYAPTPQIGFEMIILRMLAFQPCAAVFSTEENAFRKQAVDPARTEPAGSARTEAVDPIRTEPVDSLDWPNLVSKLTLSGISKQLAEHCSLREYAHNTLHLVLDEAQKPLLQTRSEDKLRQSVSEYLGRNLRLKITLGRSIEGQTTPAVQYQQQQASLQEAAKELMETDQKLGNLLRTFNARIEKIELEK